jgi:hypothetical protein
MMTRKRLMLVMLVTMVIPLGAVGDKGDLGVCRRYT